MTPDAVRYFAGTDGRGNPVLLKQVDDHLAPLAMDVRHDLRRHSEHPNFGYSGSGPAQAALMILADVCGDQFALEAYQLFKRSVVARADPGTFSLTAAQVEAWARDFEDARAGRPPPRLDDGDFPA